MKEGLAVRGILYYVSTRGGETRESYYLISPEVLAFIREYLGEKLKTPLFPEELEAKHLAFHVLDTIGRRARYGVISLEDLEGVSNNLRVEGIKKVLDEFEGKALRFDLSNNRYVILDADEYFKEVRNRYFEPLVRHVLREEKKEEKGGSPRGTSCDSYSIR